MDKILLINKEKGMTSRDVINRLVKVFNTKKIGHFGTLDPLATGLLVVGIGAFTKLGNILDDETKEYEVEVLIGKSTDTYDITGKVINFQDISLEKEKIVSCLNSFLGVYMQEVPIYSAVKVNGKKLYEYARSGEEVVLPKKEVEILSISFKDLYERDGNKYFSFSCLVSKGTYIRSLINDISIKLGVSLCMSNLKRTKCGNFSIENSFTLDDVESNNFSFLDITDVFDLEIIEVSDSLEHLVLNGTEIDIISDKMILFTKDGSYISLYGVYKNKMKPFLTFKKE